MVYNLVNLFLSYKIIENCVILALCLHDNCVWKPDFTNSHICIPVVEHNKEAARNLCMIQYHHHYWLHTYAIQHKNSHDWLAFLLCVWKPTLVNTISA